MKPTPHLFKVRAKMKAHQPLFVVKEHHKSARIKRRWRAQRGIHSGHRQMHRGKPAQPTPGFGVPKAVRGLHSSGLQPVLVHSISQLDAIDVQRQGLIIGATVGTRKRLQLLEMAAEKKITLLQVADAHKVRDALQSAFSARVKAKKEKLSTKSKKEEEQKKKGAAKEKEKKVEVKAGPSAEKESAGSIEDAVAPEEKEKEKDKEKDKKNKEQQEAEKMLIKPQ